MQCNSWLHASLSSVPKSVFWRTFFVPVVEKNEVTHFYPTGSWTRKYQDSQDLRSVQTFASLYDGYKLLWALQASISLFYFCSFLMLVLVCGWWGLFVCFGGVYILAFAFFTEFVWFILFTSKDLILPVLFEKAFHCDISHSPLIFSHSC